MLCANYEKTEHDVYVPYTWDREMRSVPVYKRDRTANGPVKRTHYARVTSHGVDRIKMHSKVSVCLEPASPNSFLDALRSSPNIKKWGITCTWMRMESGLYMLCWMVLSTLHMAGHTSHKLKRKCALILFEFNAELARNTCLFILLKNLHTPQATCQRYLVPLQHNSSWAQQCTTHRLSIKRFCRTVIPKGFSIMTGKQRGS